MSRAPKWYLPVAVVALLWNLLGCAAYLADVSLSPEEIAKMPPAQQELYASRTVWSTSATAIAVWGGALGCLGLILGKRWATWLLVASLVGVVVQDIGIFVVSNAGSLAGSAAYVLQGLVLAIATLLVVLARRARAGGWIT